MITEEQIQGGWNELKGKAKQHWGDLNDDELRQFEGSFDEFVGHLQRKTGEAREQVHQWLSQVQRESGDTADSLLASASEYAEQARAAANDAAARVRDGVTTGRAEAQRAVRRHPLESLGVAFGAGIIAGVVVGLVTRSNKS